MKRVAFAMLMLGAALAPPAHAEVFDGRWSVLVITDRGACDRGYRYEVAVAEGRVTYIGGAAVRVAGTVAPNGAVNVSIRSGRQIANGLGRLSAGAGTGTWQGQGNAGACSGHWEAERR
ncbi:MAG: hypothetical protein ACRECC_10375 [Pseudolabrys sp.]